MFYIEGCVPVTPPPALSSEAHQARSESWTTGTQVLGILPPCLPTEWPDSP